MIHPGKYLARATGPDEAQFCQANTGTDQVFVRYRITAGENQGETIGEYFSLSEAAMPYTIEKLRTSGAYQQGVTDPFDLTGLGDFEVELVVEADDFNGKTRSRIKYVNDPKRRGGNAPIAEDKAAALKAKMKAQILASRGSAPPAPVGPKPTGGDVPF